MHCLEVIKARNAVNKQIVVTIAVPVNYNDGAKIPDDTFSALLSRFVCPRFNGYTISGVCSGYYDGQVEPVRLVMIGTTIENLTILRSVARRIGQQLGQRTVYLSYYEAKVELLDI